MLWKFSCIQECILVANLQETLKCSKVIASTTKRPQNRTSTSLFTGFEVKRKRNTSGIGFRSFLYIFSFYLKKIQFKNRSKDWIFRSVLRRLFCTWRKPCSKISLVLLLMIRHLDLKADPEILHVFICWNYFPAFFGIYMFHEVVLFINAIWQH